MDVEHHSTDGPIDGCVEKTETLTGLDRKEECLAGAPRQFTRSQVFLERRRRALPRSQR
jgi:hypothetical protein